MPDVPLAEPISRPARSHIFDKLIERPQLIAELVTVYSARPLGDSSPRVETATLRHLKHLICTPTTASPLTMERPEPHFSIPDKRDQGGWTVAGDSMASEQNPATVYASPQLDRSIPYTANSRIVSPIRRATVSAGSSYS